MMIVKIIIEIYVNLIQTYLKTYTPQFINLEGDIISEIE